MVSLRRRQHARHEAPANARKGAIRWLFAWTLVVALVSGSFGYYAGVRNVFAPDPAAAAGACVGFVDVDGGDPACVAISTLVANRITSGYATNPPTFGPTDAVQRAQIAAFLVRALSWQGMATGPRSFSDFGPLVAELRNASLVLANQCDSAGACVATGYGDGRFGPTDPVTHAQVLSFIARAFRFDPTRAWQPQTTGTVPYSGVPGVHLTDVRTYDHYAGTIPAAPTTADGWNSPAPRAWVARVLFQGLGLPPATPAWTLGVCGEDMMHWHAPVINTCATGHDHGDAPPAWVNSSRWMAMFDHPGNTPNENVLKHSSFKAFSLRLDGVDIYLIMHLDTNPNGHTSRFHSYQAWARDGAGGVSHWDLWADFGSGNETGPHLQAPDNCGNDGTRPIMMVNYVDCPRINGSVPFENWYSRAAAPLWGWDLGFNIQPQYFGGPTKGVSTNGDLANMANWLPTGNLNANRRVEMAWYTNRSNQRGDFWSTQWGEIVSGPNDARCGQQRTFGTKSYTTLCIAQYVAPSMSTVQFTGNAFQKTYPLPGVKLPN